ncbi:hypothetical protein LMG26296_05532 [Cupriavidus plantarum]|nr:hypothetical protein LMG26296_05532 [Cupriavidus plantarum]
MAFVILGQTERGDRILQAASLFLQRAGGSSGLLHERRVLLRHLVHLRHGLIDLLDARTLLGRGRADLAHDVGHALHCLHDLAHRLAGFAHEHGTVVHARHGIADQALDFLRRIRGALRQAAHLAGHHREAAALFARACRFHGRVQRQDVGLERDAFDHADDVDDLARGFVDLVHRLHHAADHFAAAHGGLGRVGGQTAGLTGVVRVLAHGAGQLFHARGGFLERSGLLLGTLRQIVVTRGDFTRRRADRFGRLLEIAHHARQVMLHLAHRVQQARLVTLAQRHLAGEIAIGDTRGNARRVARFAAELARQAAREKHAQQHGDHQAAQHQHQHDHARALVHAVRFVHVGARTLVAALHHLEQHVFQGTAVLEQVSAFREHRAFELRRVQRLLAHEFNVLRHALTERRHEGLVLLHHGLAFRLRERALGGLHAFFHGRQRLLDALLLGRALAHRGCR